MGKKKVFPTVNLSVPKIEHTRDPAGGVVIAPDVIPPADTVVRFPAEGNASNLRNFDFARWYGAGVDLITYACQRQIERFIATHDGDRAVTTVASYCDGLKILLDYLLLRSAAACRTLTLDDINRDVIDGLLGFLNDGKRATVSQVSSYNSVKAVLVALSKRGLLRIVEGGEDESITFPRNPFPNSYRKAKGEQPLPKAQRRAFTAAVKTAVMPLLVEDVEPTSELLAYALLVVALHTGRNTTPLLEMGTDCLRAHPKDQVQFLVLFKRRGNKTSKAPLRDEKYIESIPPVRPTVVRLIRRAIELTASLRAEAPAYLKNRVWLYRSLVSSSAGKVTALNSAALARAIDKLVKICDYRDTDGKPLRINISRLRKTFANRINEILGDDLATTAIALGNTPQIAGRNYLRPGENAKRNWSFMGAALTQELLSATIGATERTPTGRCTDNKQGEHAPKNGATCMSFLDCLRCRNYVVTGDDLYRLYSFYWRIVLERGRMDKRKWQKHYAHIVRLIDCDVIETGIEKKIFTQQNVDAARERARTDPHPYWRADDILETLLA